jgi:aryl-alcohol dehydrogenase-like predicted oxidoreductase
MPFRILGRTGLQASAVGLGTWKFGLPETGDGSRVGEKAAFKIFDRALELGVTFWDTANRYNNGSGNSERVIGRWLEANPDQRRNIILATKIYGGMDGATPNHSRLSRHNILESVYACLKRLQTNYIDLLYFHSLDTPIAPLEESLSAVEDLVRRDLVRYFAISNASVEQIKQFQEAEKQFSARVRVAAVQNHYDLLNGEWPQLAGVMDQSASLGISFIAWSPLARGLLTNRYLQVDKAGDGDRLVDEGTLQKDLADPNVAARLAALGRLARKWGLPLNELVLAYMLTIPGMGPVIPASSTVAQIESNAKSALLKLEHDQLNQIEETLITL